MYDPVLVVKVRCASPRCLVSTSAAVTGMKNHLCGSMAISLPSRPPRSVPASSRAGWQRRHSRRRRVARSPPAGRTQRWLALDPARRSPWSRQSRRRQRESHHAGGPVRYALRALSTSITSRPTTGIEITSSAAMPATVAERSRDPGPTLPMSPKLERRLHERPDLPAKKPVAEINPLSSCPSHLTSSGL